jgi:hypothetical protein
MEVVMPHPFSTQVGIRRLATAAVAAPSVYNTQPWRIRYAGGEVLELHADPRRRLKVIDPRGRALHMSCGAALFNLRLAIRVTGYRPLVRLLPDPARPTLMATVRAVKVPAAPVTEAKLYAAIPLRHTNRYPFERRLVPPAICQELVEAARAERATLGVADAQTASYLVDLIGLADRELADDDDYRAELASWTSGARRADGVPWYTFGPRPSRNGGLPVRDFGLTRPVHGRECDRFRGRPQLGVLMTRGDEPRDWLRAGQALQRVLLTATRYGVSASLLDQPLELRDRGRDLDGPHTAERIQTIIRFGYGPPVPSSPRRPVPEILSR